MSPRKIIIDTDPGIDDAMAILYALNDPALDLLGLTTVFGNVPVATATRNAIALLHHVGRSLPVAEGAARPLELPPQPHPDFVHGADGFGGAALHDPGHDPHHHDAADFIIQQVRAHPGEVTLIPIGPLTNIAEALTRDPGIAPLVAEVLIMGGAVRRRGNVSPHAEANIWQDPHAAELVLAADWPLRLVGLDVTEEVRCTHAHFIDLAERRPRAGGFLRDAVRFYMDFHVESQGFDGCFMHDPTAVIAAVQPGFFVTERIALTAVREGDRLGATIPAADGRRPAAVCLGVQAAELREHFLRIIASGPLP
ncbi:nucleoside hydrolase [Rhodobacteraceae bacterium NNCM2]|nr:nucleoside hydrolase [Coraliihabitans acroporae]